MSDAPARRPRPSYWIRVSGNVPTPHLAVVGDLAVAQGPPITILRIQTDETPAELLAHLRSHGLDVVSVRRVG